MYNWQTETYFRGGMRRLAAGLMPFSNAFLACIMKCLVGDFETIVSTNLPAVDEKQKNFNRLKFKSYVPQL